MRSTVINKGARVMWQKGAMVCEEIKKHEKARAVDTSMYVIGG